MFVVVHLFLRGENLEDHGCRSRHLEPLLQPAIRDLGLDVPVDGPDPSMKTLLLGVKVVDVNKN